MKFLVPNYSCLQNPWLWAYRPQITVLSVLCRQLNLLNPPGTKFQGTPLALLPFCVYMPELVKIFNALFLIYILIVLLLPFQVSTASTLHLTSLVQCCALPCSLTAGPSHAVFCGNVRCRICYVLMIVVCQYKCTRCFPADTASLPCKHKAYVGVKKCR